MIFLLWQEFRRKYLNTGWVIVRRLIGLLTSIRLAQISVVELQMTRTALMTRSIL